MRSCTWANAGVLAGALGAALSAAGCGRVTDDGAGPAPIPAGVRPVGAASPRLRSLAGRSKVDLLLAIDNSAGMGDKQAYLADAVPRLVQRLLAPRCVDENAASIVVGPSVLDGAGVATCPAGSKPEFPALTDLHVAVVSSSLGGRGGDQCTGGAGGHADDRGHLVDRGDASGGPFLSWRPTADASAGAGAAAFTASLAARVRAVGDDGCGYEAPLESLYRFLVQPDPSASLEKQGDVVVQRDVDWELLAERRAFLRPDSVVAIVMLTDEDESSVAPGAFSGRSWFFEDSKHVRPGTSACAADPDSPRCVSCYLKEAEGDPACTGALDDSTDNVNVRFFDMKRRFGVDPRYPVDRYVRGLRAPRVPSRDREWDGVSYVGGDDSHATCINPLFAMNLPEPGADLCGLTVGPRQPEDVLFLAIGGVPWQLLSSRPDDLSATSAGRTVTASLDAATWRRVLGDGEAHEGRHPLMRPSIKVRADVAVDGAHGRDWNTLGTTLQSSCVFRLPAPRDCTRPENAEACDCGGPSMSPLCDATNPTQQVAARAVPTLRMLEVARGLGPQGLVASICPMDDQPSGAGSGEPNARYGYRAALDALGDRMVPALAPRCLATPFDDACSVLAPSDGRPCHDQGLLDPPGVERSGHDTAWCALPRAEGDCLTGRGFCVVSEGGACASRIVVAPGTVGRDAALTLSCP